MPKPKMDTYPAPPAELSIFTAVLANHCLYTLFERQSRGGGGPWRMRMSS